MKVTLTILKEDIETANIADSHDCPITRALERAGYPNLREVGGRIINDLSWTIVANLNTDKAYLKMWDTMCHMKSTFLGTETPSRDGVKNVPTTPKTFKATINLNI